jgi:hypothetical protein
MAIGENDLAAQGIDGAVDGFALADEITRPHNRRE